MASTPEAVQEVLVKKSVDYAGRQQTYSFYTLSLGMLKHQCYHPVLVREVSTQAVGPGGVGEVFPSI